MEQNIEAAARAANSTLDSQAEEQRLQTLVGELLATNQDLRFKVVELEQKAERLRRALNNAAVVQGLMML